MFYGTANGFKQYFAERNREVDPIYTDSQIEGVLLVASEWLDNSYSDKWVGLKTGGFEQSRSWPRQAAVENTYPYHTYPPTEIPKKVEYGTYEAAIRQLNEQGYLLKDFTPNQYDSVSVVGAVSVQYNRSLSSSGFIQNEIPIIGNLLKSLIDSSTSNDTVISGSCYR